MKPVAFKSLLLSTFILLAGCATTSGNSASTGSSSSSGNGTMNDLIVNAQLPAGARINHSQSLIMGSGENWVGRVMLELDQNPNAAYNFFLEQYPQQGWTLVSAVRGKTSLLVFTKADRSATVELNEGGVMGGSQATLTVTPKSTLPPAPTPSTQPVRR
ncbi:hypothetical protein [Brevundimonas sp.]|uniref:hypothetical protein n=1 Tax=Brevundimonas sp. TaxID=1871086 RepID=UPI002730AC4F|nr:hypothetical protein [Brevundimonas sp.]MDP1657665.1 hypothetical protein [Hylemonella sp.]MDP1913381.1 hypothetical protein [Brevundimonas sp.]